MRRKRKTEIEIPRIEIKVQSFFRFVLPFLILVSIFEMLVLNA